MGQILKAKAGILSNFYYFRLRQDALALAVLMEHETHTTEIRVKMKAKVALLIRP